MALLKICVLDDILLNKSIDFEQDSFLCPINESSLYIPKECEMNNLKKIKHGIQSGNTKIEFAHGTTTLAFKYKNGVIVAVDSRASMGSYIAFQTVKNVIEVTSYLLGTMTGATGIKDLWILRNLKKEYAKEVDVDFVRSGTESSAWSSRHPPHLATNRPGILGRGPARSRIPTRYSIHVLTAGRLEAASIRYGPVVRAAATVAAVAGIIDVDSAPRPRNPVDTVFVVTAACSSRISRPTSTASALSAGTSASAARSAASRSASRVTGSRRVPVESRCTIGQQQHRRCHWKPTELEIESFELVACSEVEVRYAGVMGCQAAANQAMHALQRDRTADWRVTMVGDGGLAVWSADLLWSRLPGADCLVIEYVLFSLSFSVHVSVLVF